MGVAFHLDRGDEDDRYEFPVAIGYVLGFARHPALGVLINEGGNDVYRVAGDAGALALGMTETLTGDRQDASGTLGTPSVGMFLDLGGTGDVFDLMRAGTGNHATWVQTPPQGPEWDARLDHGYGFDSE